MQIREEKAPISFVTRFFGVFLLFFFFIFCLQIVFDLLMSGAENLPDKFLVVDVSVLVFVRTDEQLHFFVRQSLA